MTVMKKISSALLYLLCCVLAGLLIGWAASRVFAKNGTYTITFCETTDTHGAYFDSLYVGDSTNPTSFSNVSAYLRQIREAGIKPVLIDAGDNLQGDNAAYYYNFVDTSGTHLVPQIFEYLGYDAVVVGNHDIEPGHPVYDKIRKEMKIPYLAANAVTEDGKAYFQEYKLIKRDGIRIAIIGMTNANIKSWLAEDKWTGLEFKQISTMAQDVVDRVVRKTRPHVVVLAVHSGKGDGSADIENEALCLASTLKGVDIVFYGHDHMAVSELVQNPDREVAMLNAGSRNANVARCDMTVTLKRGKVVSRSFESAVVPMTEYGPEPEYDSHFRNQFESVRAFATGEMGELMGDLDFSGVLAGPCAYISLVHKVQLAATSADISITAPLSTNGCVKKGKVTFQDLANIYRFENTLNKVELTGRQIKDYLEYSYDHWINGEGPSYNFDSAAGIDYVVKKSAEKGHRVEIKGMSSGEPFCLDSVYTVAMNSYRCSGGGRLLAEGALVDPAALKVIGKFKDIRSLIGDYIASKVVIEPEVSSNWKFVE